MTDLMSSSLLASLRGLHQQTTMEDTLAVILRSTAEELPAFEHVGVSVTKNGEPVTTPAATTDLVRELDSLQYSLDQGPCYDVVAGADARIVPHIRHEQRWPDYVANALGHGLQAQMAFQLYLDDAGTVGGFNLYSTTSPEITENDVILGNLFATNAAAALGRRREVDQLTESILGRQRIGQATGYLMARYSLTEEAAQTFLWRTSSHRNIKVREVAAEIIDHAHTEVGQAEPRG